MLETVQVLWEFSALILEVGQDVKLRWDRVAWEATDGTGTAKGTGRRRRYGRVRERDGVGSRTPPEDDRERVRVSSLKPTREQRSVYEFAAESNGLAGRSGKDVGDFVADQTCVLQTRRRRQRPDSIQRKEKRFAGSPNRPRMFSAAADGPTLFLFGLLYRDASGPPLLQLRRGNQTS